MFKKQEHELMKRLNEIERKLIELEQRDLYFSQIDLVNFGRLKIFMYKNDLAYQNVDESLKGYTAEQLAKEEQVEFVSPDLSTVSHQNVIFQIIQFYARENLKFTYIDVGCQYGTNALTIADYIHNSAIDGKVIAFDPGIAGQLAEKNIEINGFQDMVKFEPIGVGATKNQQLCMLN